MGREGQINRYTKISSIIKRKKDYDKKLAGQKPRMKALRSKVFKVVAEGLSKRDPTF